MTWDIHFGDGTIVRSEGKTFHCACIVAQCKRIAYGETHDEQLAVVGGIRVDE
jgi:hypothetical protein